jgi:hypothetical protein
MLELGLSGSVRGVFSNGHPYREPRPVSDVGIAGHRPTIVLYEHSISPNLGAHLEQRAGRAAGGNSGGGCRGLLTPDRDRRRRHTGATETRERLCMRS